MQFIFNWWVTLHSKILFVIVDRGVIVRWHLYTDLWPQVAMQFITMYSYEDIVTANIEGSSGSVWRISPPSRQELIKELTGSTGDMTLRLDWNFQRSVTRVILTSHASRGANTLTVLVCLCVSEGILGREERWKTLSTSTLSVWHERTRWERSWPNFCWVTALNLCKSTAANVRTHV